MTWLVTGGAGYIGSHVAQALLEDGHPVVVLDDLSSGRQEFVPAGCVLEQGTLLDAEFLEHGFCPPHGGRGHPPCRVQVRRALGGMARPLPTARTSPGTINLLAAMEKHSVDALVFSSSAAVYGNAAEEFVTESTAPNPQSPYGESKLIGEWLIAGQGRATGLRHTSLRYFNVVGSGLPNVSDTSPHNLFPLVFRALKAGAAPKIFGTAFPTPDGSCIRDYVHVTDIAAAHVAAARKLHDGAELAATYNLGSGAGSSVREIMAEMAAVTGVDFSPQLCEPAGRGPSPDCGIGRTCPARLRLAATPHAPRDDRQRLGKRQNGLQRRTMQHPPSRKHLNHGNPIVYLRQHPEPGHHGRRP